MDANQSVLDALNLAGGIRKSGSLRSIKIIRGGQSQMVDLYDFIVDQNVPQAMQLQDGDRIIIPPIGPTFAVTGDVKQAGIFELKSHFGKTRPENLQGALIMAGGVLGGGDLEFSLKRADGNVVNLSRNGRATINDGAILTVMRATDRLNNAIEVKGYSRKNGLYDLGSAGTLHALMGDRRLFGDNTYPLMGVISRIKRDSLTRHLMGFSAQSIALGHDDRQLEAGDIIYLFSNDDIAEILNDNKQKNIIKNNDENKFPQSISSFILDNVITIQGAFRNEGEWPVGTVTDLQTIISGAGGLTSRASRSDIEITSRHYELGNAHRRRNIDVADMRLSDVMLEAGDQIRVNEQFDQAVEKTVRITGEVRNPGAYDLMRGDTLSTLINRAGGLTAEAYPPAAVFSRKAERKREEQKFRNAAQELERTVSVNLNAVDKGASLTPAQISIARQLADDLRSVQAIGRVTVEADPAVLSVRPELDMLLDDGDHLHIPKRSLNVRVGGEVMNPASLLFMDDKDVSDYLREAGGKTYYADNDRIFVVYPDGSAQPVRGFGWGSDKPAMVIPGSTIIVPRDPKPFNFMDSFKDITQILTNMAITGVFVEDIANDEN
jgi:protein involved in polysaccharide export with SLBB domain